MNGKDAFRENLRRNIAADIVLSGDPGAAIRRWRDIFRIYQCDLARKMNVRSSIISDYESGRRKSPGASTIKNIADAFISIDNDGDALPEAIMRGAENLRDAIIDSKDLAVPRTLKDITTALAGKILAEESDLGKDVSGYVIIDSIRAIITFSPTEFSDMYGIMSGRAVVFAGAERGRSPIVAIKVAKVRPSVVIFYGIKELDKVAERIARAEKIPVILSGIRTMDEIITTLKSM